MASVAASSVLNGSSTVNCCILAVSGVAGPSAPEAHLVLEAVVLGVNCSASRASSLPNCWLSCMGDDEGTPHAHPQCALSRSRLNKWGSTEWQQSTVISTVGLAYVWGGDRVLAVVEVEAWQICDDDG